MSDSVVVMTNKATGGVAESLRSAFDAVWSKQGWEEVDPETPLTAGTIDDTAGAPAPAARPAASRPAPTTLEG